MSRALYLEGEFGPRGVKRGGILFLDASAAIELIHAAHMRRIRVLGVDSFRLTADATEPATEWILDLTTGDRRPEESDWESAAAFVQRARPFATHFEVVLVDEVG